MDQSSDNHASGRWHPGGGKWTGNYWNPGGGASDGGFQSSRASHPGSGPKSRSRLANMVMKPRPQAPWHPPLKAPPVANLGIEDETHGTLNREGYQAEDTDLPDVTIEDETLGGQRRNQSFLERKLLSPGGPYQVGEIAKAMNLPFAQATAGRAVEALSSAYFHHKKSGDPRAVREARVILGNAMGEVNWAIKGIQDNQPRITDPSQINSFNDHIDSMGQFVGKQAFGAGKMLADFTRIGPVPVGRIAVGEFDRLREVDRIFRGGVAAGKSDEQAARDAINQSYTGTEPGSPPTPMNRRKPKK